MGKLNDHLSKHLQGKSEKMSGRLRHVSIPPARILFPAPAREFGMLGMCISCLPRVPELHVNMHAIIRALYPHVAKMSHTYFRIYVMILITQ